MSRQFFRVAAAQYRLRPIARFDDFAEQAGAVVAAAKGEFDARLVVLPEYASAQLMAIPGTNGVRDLAALAPAYVDLFAGLARAHGIAVLAGTHPLAERNRLYNVAHLFHPDGRIDRQAKLHLTPTEAGAWGMSGGAGLDLVELDCGKAAILVCYDVEFPELARQARARGARVLLVPACTDDRHGFWRVRHTAQARAIENQVYVIVAHTVGGIPVDNLRANVGRAAILSPCDYPFPTAGMVAEGETNDECVIAADLDMEAIDRAQQGGSVRTWQDRRGDLYPLAE